MPQTMPPGPSPGERLLLRNANLVDVNRGTLFPQTALSMKDGRIEALLHESEARSVTGGAVLDLSGRYVIPGFINAHCHISLPGGFGLTLRVVTRYRRQIARNAERCIENGVTTVRDMMALGGFVGALKKDIVAGRIKGPRILTCTGVDVPRGYGRQIAAFPNPRIFRAAETPAQAVRAVNEALDAGADFIKIFAQKTEHFMPGRELPQMPLPAMAAACETAEKRGSYAALHQTALYGLAKGLAAGVRSFEHVPGDGLIPDADMARLLSSGATVVPTLTVPLSLGFEMPGDPSWGKGRTLEFANRRKEVLPGLLAEFCDPKLLPAARKLLAMLSVPENYVRYRRFKFFCPLTITAEAVWGVENLLALHRAGVPLGMGNDGGIPLIFPGALALEMALWEELGVPAPAVLKAATAGGARAAAMTDRIGSIAPGMIADLAVLPRNPLESVKNAGRPALVFQEGRLVHGAASGSEQ
ncbi:MAG: amidohydrolase family protein [Thermodesulfobacteriota bacterium]